MYKKQFLFHLHSINEFTLTSNNHKYLASEVFYLNIIKKRLGKNRNELLWFLLFIIFLFVWFIWQFHLNYLIASGDTFFHAQRIYEIRNAFLQGKLPSWINLLTFHNSGQAINGMYPDLTLWPFVFITNFLSPVHQILSIRFIILFLTFLITFWSISFRYNANLAIKVSIIYTLSGMPLRNGYLEFQPGTALIMMVLFPILFTFYDLLSTTNRLDKNKIIQSSLLMTFVLFSHLMSIFVLALIVAIFAIFSLLKSKNFYPLFSCIISSCIFLITGSPIFYRYLLISKAGVLPPLGKGNTIGIPLINMLTGATWTGRETFSIVSIIILFLLFLKFNSNKIKKMLPWIYAELFLIFLSCDLMPWNLLNKIPIFDQLQNAGWRFMIFSGAIPFILLLENFSNKSLNKLLNFLVVLSLSASFQLITSFQNKDYTVLNDTTSNLIPHDQAVAMQNSGINSDKITRVLVPDYAPKSVKTLAGTNHSALSKYYQDILQNKKALLIKEKKSEQEIPYKTSKITNGFISFKFSKQHGVVQLPVFGYNSLGYNIKDNNKKIHYTVNSKGFLQVHLSKKQENTISIEYDFPILYVFFLFLSLITSICLLTKLILTKFQITRSEQ